MTQPIEMSFGTGVDLHNIVLGGLAVPRQKSRKISHEKLQHYARLLPPNQTYSSNTTIVTQQYVVAVILNYLLTYLLSHTAISRGVAGDRGTRPPPKKNVERRDGNTSCPPKYGADSALVSAGQ